MDSAVRYKELAATATVPKVAMVLVEIIPAEDMAIRSNAAGRLIRNTVFNSAQSGKYCPLILKRMGPFCRKIMPSMTNAPMVAEPEVATAAPATPHPAPGMVNSMPNTDSSLVG